MGENNLGDQDLPIDTTELLNTLSEIADADDEALARSSSSQFDEWLVVLTAWHDSLSGGIA